VSDLFIFTGDASGDIYGAEVIRALKRLQPSLTIEAIGGAEIEKTGVELFADQRQLATVGSDVLWALPKHLMLGQKIIQHLRAHPPHAVLFIDYGGFHLALAQKLQPLRRQGTRILYYIPPQIWASRRHRLQRMAKTLDHVFSIFPFEPALYQAEGIPVTDVGHPLTELLSPQPDRLAFCQQHGLKEEQEIIGLFPGSRALEVDSLLPVFLQTLACIPHAENYQFIIAASPALPFERYQAMLSRASLPEGVHVSILLNASHQIMALSRAALVASGTVTLEAAHYETPVVICYKIAWWGYWAFLALAYVRHLGLTNLLLGEENAFLPELLMSDVRPAKIAASLQPFLMDSPERAHCLAQYANIKGWIGSEKTSQRVAEGILSTLIS
jgi:lipid-A-disaccharide synthase